MSPFHTHISTCAFSIDISVRNSHCPARGITVSQGIAELQKHGTPPNPFQQRGAEEPGIKKKPQMTSQLRISMHSSRNYLKGYQSETVVSVSAPVWFSFSFSGRNTSMFLPAFFHYFYNNFDQG